MLASRLALRAGAAPPTGRSPAWGGSAPA